MAVDAALLEKVRKQLEGLRGIKETSLFGGAGFMLNGKLLCGVMKESLMVRTDKNDFEKFISDGATPMVMAGKSGKSFLMVHKSKISRGSSMKKWISRAIGFVDSLPKK